MIDTHSAIKKLQSGGFNEQQAEVLVFVVNDLSNQTVTKSELSSELGKFSNELKLEIQEVRSAVQEVKNELKIQSLSQNFNTNMRWIIFMFATMATLFIGPVVSNIIKFW